MSINQNFPQSNSHNLSFTAGIPRNVGAPATPQIAIRPASLPTVAVRSWHKPVNTCALAVRAYGHTVIGALGEVIAKRWLQDGGYRVETCKGADLAVLDPTTGALLYIEVKTARRGINGRWSAVLEKQDHTSAKNADRVILFCVTADRQTIPFVIPASEIAGRRSINIPTDPRTYAGRWAQYRADWGTDPL